MTYPQEVIERFKNGEEIFVSKKYKDKLLEVLLKRKDVNIDRVSEIEVRKETDVMVGDGYTLRIKFGYIQLQDFQVQSIIDSYYNKELKKMEVEKIALGQKMSELRGLRDSLKEKN